MIRSLEIDFDEEGFSICREHRVLLVQLQGELEESCPRCLEEAEDEIED